MHRMPCPQTPHSQNAIKPPPLGGFAPAGSSGPPCGPAPALRAPARHPPGASPLALRAHPWSSRPRLAGLNRPPAPFASFRTCYGRSAAGLKAKHLFVFSPTESISFVFSPTRQPVDNLLLRGDLDSCFYTPRFVFLHTKKNRSAERGCKPEPQKILSQRRLYRATS